MTIEQDAVRALEEALSIHAYTHPSHEARCGAMRGAITTALTAIKREQALQAQDHEQPKVDYRCWADLPAIPAILASDVVHGAAKNNPSTLGQQVARAQAEMATWTPEQRASVRLAGGDHVEQASPVAQDERSQFEHWMVHEAKCIVGSSDPYVAEMERDRWATWQAAYKAGRASVAVPAAQPVGEAVAFGYVVRSTCHGETRHSIFKQRVFNSEHDQAQCYRQWVEQFPGRLGSENAHQGIWWEITKHTVYTAPPVAQDQDAARYRWLREKRDIPHGTRNIPWAVALDPAERIHTMVARTGAELDFAIDAAIQAEVKS